MTKKIKSATVKVASGKNILVEVIRNFGATSIEKLPVKNGAPDLGKVRNRQVRKAFGQAWAEWLAALALKTLPRHYIEASSHRAAPTNSGVGGGRYPSTSNGELQGWFLSKSVITLVDEPHVVRVYRSWGVRLVSGLVMRSRITGKVMWEPALTQNSGLLWDSLEAYKASLDDKGRIADVSNATPLKHRRGGTKGELWYEDPRAYEAMGVAAPYSSKH